jgi:hypothetical protein
MAANLSELRRTPPLDASTAIPVFDLRQAVDPIEFSYVRGVRPAYGLEPIRVLGLNLPRIRRAGG